MANDVAVWDAEVVAANGAHCSQVPSVHACPLKQGKEYTDNGVPAFYFPWPHIALAALVGRDFVVTH